MNMLYLHCSASSTIRNNVCCLRRSEKLLMLHCSYRTVHCCHQTLHVLLLSYGTLLSPDPTLLLSYGTLLSPDPTLLLSYGTLLSPDPTLLLSYLDTWILGVASKQLRLLHGRVEDSTIVVNSLSPQMSELVEDAISSWCGDIVGHFGNELYNRDPNTVIAFSWRDCAGFLFVGYWITHCVSCLGCFLVFIACPIVPSIFGTICCVIFQIYIII